MLGSCGWWAKSGSVCGLSIKNKKKQRRGEDMEVKGDVTVVFTFV